MPSTPRTKTDSRPRSPSRPVGPMTTTVYRCGQLRLAEGRDDGRGTGRRDDRTATQTLVSPDNPTVVNDERERNGDAVADAEHARGRRGAHRRHQCRLEPLATRHGLEYPFTHDHVARGSITDMPTSPVTPASPSIGWPGTTINAPGDRPPHLNAVNHADG